MSARSTTASRAKRKSEIGPKEAALAARDYFADVAQYDGEAILEEIERSSDGEHWLVTLGYHAKFLDEFVNEEKQYKLFQVDCRTGEVVSMRIRSV
jgi:hypothetical protein